MEKLDAETRAARHLGVQGPVARGSDEQHILVICAAGASSTFLVHRMRREARAKGLSVEIHAGTPRELATARPDDCVLVAHHLAEEYPALSREADALGIRIALLPAVPDGGDGQGAALAAAADLARQTTTRPRR